MSLDFLKGYRTKFGAAAMILSGAAVVLQALSSGDWAHLAEGTGAIGAGLAALGIRFAQS